MKTKNKYWALTEHWNKATISEDKPLEKRNYLWASELGAPDVDVLRRTQAQPYSNPPNERAKRKFMAGNIWEGVIELILNSLDLLIERQARVDHEVSGQRITGYADYIAGGTPFLESAETKFEDLPLAFFPLATKIFHAVKEDFEDQNFERVVLEVKSVSSFGFERIKEFPIYRHFMQCFTYMKALSLNGRIIYVCKDDCRMKEFYFSQVDQNLISLWREEIEKKKKVLKTGKAVPEPLLVFKNEKFAKNLDVEYSPYLKEVYGFEDPGEYRDFAVSKAASFNRVLQRVRKGKELTKDNKEKLKEMRSYHGKI